MSIWAQKKGKEIPGTRNEMETKKQNTICTLKLGPPGGIWWSQKPRSLGFSGDSGTGGKIESPHEVAIHSEREREKRPKEMTGEHAFLGVTSARGNHWNPRPALTSFEVQGCSFYMVLLTSECYISKKIDLRCSPEKRGEVSLERYRQTRIPEDQPPPKMNVLSKI